MSAAAVWGRLDGQRGGLVQFGAGPADVGRRCAGRVVYLATPCTRVMLQAERAERGMVAEVLAFACARELDRLAEESVTAVSPVLLGLAMIEARGDGFSASVLEDAAFWAGWCRPILHACAAVVVPRHPGWDRSDGVAHEAEWALGRNTPVFVYGPEPGA